MSKYTCTNCNPEGVDAPCILEVIDGTEAPVYCPYRYDMDDNADLKRVAPQQAVESKGIINNYTFRARNIEINTKEDVNKAIQQLSDCITDLHAIDWPEDIEYKSRLGVKA